MGTFLTTPKMSPDLAARIERSLRADRPKVGREFAERTRVSVFGGLLILAVVTLVVLFVLIHVRDARKLADRRASVLAALAGKRGALTPDESSFLDRNEPWLVSLATAATPDHVAARLRTPLVLRTLLARPTLYLRGHADDLVRRERLAAASSASNRDFFVLCAASPPAARDEATVLKHVRGVAFGGPAFDKRTAHVFRWHDVELGFALFRPGFQARIEAATDGKVLGKLRSEIDAAPVADAKLAAAAEVLVIVVDEDDASPVEVERRHFAKVIVADLRSHEPLLRLRHEIDPGTLSPGVARAHGREVTSCLMALAVHDAVP